jgi:HSP20 family protein
MAKREKQKDGAKLPQRTAERMQSPAPGTDVTRSPETGFHPLAQLRQEMDQLFDRFFSGWPTLSDFRGRSDLFWNMDVEDTDNAIRVRAEAPGFEPKDFDINISGNTLTIQAEHREESEQSEKGVHSHQERFGRFQRLIPLSSAVDASKVEATYQNGVLELNMPKTESASKQRIEVKS